MEAQRSRKSRCRMAGSLDVCQPAHATQCLPMLRAVSQAHEHVPLCSGKFMSSCRSSTSSRTRRSVQDDTPQYVQPRCPSSARLLAEQGSVLRKNRSWAADRPSSTKVPALRTLSTADTSSRRLSKQKLRTDQLFSAAVFKHDRGRLLEKRSFSNLRQPLLAGANAKHAGHKSLQIGSMLLPDGSPARIGPDMR